MKTTVPVLVVELLRVRLPVLLMLPDNVSVCVAGAFIVAAPLKVIGLLNASVVTFDWSMELAPMVIGAELEPNAAALPTFKVPLLRAILVLTVLA